MKSPASTYLSTTSSQAFFPFVILPEQKKERHFSKPMFKFSLKNSSQTRCTYVGALFVSIATSQLYVASKFREEKGNDNRRHKAVERISSSHSQENRSIMEELWSLPDREKSYHIKFSKYWSPQWMSPCLENTMMTTIHTTIRARGGRPSEPKAQFIVCGRLKQCCDLSFLKDGKTGCHSRSQRLSLQSQQQMSVSVR